MSNLGGNTPWPDAGCCWPDYPGGCVCLPMEKALRAWKRTDPFIAPMTQEQRAACLSEISSIEGYRAEDYQNSPDKELAAGVLSAWTDYARDKGLL